MKSELQQQQRRRAYPACARLALKSEKQARLPNTRRGRKTDGARRFPLCAQLLGGPERARRAAIITRRATQTFRISGARFRQVLAPRALSILCILRGGLGLARRAATRRENLPLVRERMRRFCRARRARSVFPSRCACAKCSVALRNVYRL